MVAKDIYADRISFKKNFQRKIFDTIKRRIGPTWAKDVCRILDLRPSSYIYSLRKEESRLSPKQLESLIKEYSFLRGLQIESGIINVEKFTEVRSRVGKIGGKIGGKRVLEMYPGKLQKQAVSGGMATLRKHGRIYFKRLAEAGAQKGGFAAIEKSKPTKQMKRLISQNQTLGLEMGKDFFINHTIDFGKCKRNIDFVYVRNNKINIVEEATDTLPYRKVMYPRLLEAIKLRNLLNKDVKLLFTFQPDKAKTNGFVLRTDPAVILEMIKENIIPIFDIDNIDIRQTILSGLLKNKPISAYIKNIKKIYETDLNRRLVKQRSMVKIAFDKKMNNAERRIHNMLRGLNLQPTGKIIMKSDHGSHTEVDNSFKLNGKQYIVMVTETKSDQPELIASHVRQHVGQAFFIKRLCRYRGEIISIILSRKKTLGHSKWASYLHDFTVPFSSLSEFQLFINKLRS